MSLDNKQKRGSAINLGSPFRPWISEPQASSSFGSRLSFLGFFAYVSVVVTTTLFRRTIYNRSGSRGM